MSHMSSTKDVLVVFALRAEARGHFDDFNLVYTGVGKVNAAYRLSHAIFSWKAEKGHFPDMVLNLGSAGSTKFECGEVVNCTKFIQRDFDTTAVGEDIYQTPFEIGSELLENGIPFSEWPQGICGTGDTFVTEGGDHSWNVMDMESYALAKVCKFEKIPFACFKYITDGADGDAGESWVETVDKSAANLYEVTQKILGT